MEQKYETVPSMISGKDLDYLTDMFNWNFNVCKLINHFYDEVEDEDVKTLFKELHDMHKEHCIAVLNILE